MKQGLARLAYGALLRLATPLYLLRLWRRGAAEPLYRRFLGERLGLYKAPAGGQGWLWIHAVSLGETRAAAALIAELRRLRPGLRLLLTHSTATGRETGLGLLEAGDAQAWLPYDTPGAVRRFLAHWKPALGVLMETEIWPNLQQETARAGVPMVLANARLSARSQRRGERFAALLRPAAQSLALALAQTEADAARLRASGVAAVRVVGNLKYDLQPDAALLARGQAWREHLGRPVLLAAVTREGEEALLLEAWQQRPGSERPLLLVVPRHPQRFDEVAALLQAAGLRLARRSRWQDLPPEEALAADAWLGDSMREMALYYGLADAALLGGSFAPLGGQNLIEAAACGCPIVMGPHTFNFAEAAELAEAAGAALRVPDMSAGLDEALALCAQPERRAAIAGRAQAFAAEHRGAAARMAQAILALVR
ncbi:3-deoxy-D-manno-octulosonic acid transferase [Roseateles violae]|uniref:3-deoxy-D-manno-octulosonic acid transferase n=1 Tax=Roseateles violae TaxID=3058042 RepID=A0ABT8DQS0_9BURK|nr:3-deoxy-D-manno-octulosonic acid transferase [Pelomonas sp. PFR6]MDN3920527.1 3-deoxy-D-manno-octulosonic acid transferase [Pelomonas sp. PFR6]